MVLNLLQEIREMIHGLGEKKPRIDTVKTFQSVLVKQMALLIYQTQQVADKDKGIILIKHIIYVLKDYKHTIIRLLIHYLSKENISKYTTSGYIEEVNQECCDKNTNKLFKLDEDDLFSNKYCTESMYNFDGHIDTLSFDPIDILTSINFKIKEIKNGRPITKSIYNQIVNSLKEFKPDLKITKDDIDNSRKTRQLRVNELSLVLSPSRYETFGHCRRKTFLNKKGDFLLHEVHKALPFNIFYTKDVKAVFLVLAKETLACLFDYLCKNRIFIVDAPKFGIILEEEDATIKVNRHDSILVPEITLVIKSIWNESLGDICFPYKENNKFFANKLIFD